MTDQELKDLVASLAVSQKKTYETIRKLSQMYGGASNNQGKLAEEFFFNSLKYDPVLGGIRFDYIDKNITRSKGDIQEEFDIILVKERLYI